jgi:regulator of replication initiation timing
MEHSFLVCVVYEFCVSKHHHHHQLRKHHHRQVLFKESQQRHPVSDPKVQLDLHKSEEHVAELKKEVKELGVKSIDLNIIITTLRETASQFESDKEDDEKNRKAAMLMSKTLSDKKLNKLQACFYICMCIYVFIYVCMYICIYMYSCMDVCMNVMYIYIYIYTYIYMYICMSYYTHEYIFIYREKLMI